MPVYGRNLLQSFPPETVRPGDVYICNDPWICNGQTADVFITTPAFRGERLIGFSINSVHHVDIGGRKGSGLSEEVYEEELIPPLKLYDDGTPNEQLFAILYDDVARHIIVHIELDGPNEARHALCIQRVWRLCVGRHPGGERGAAAIMILCRVLPEQDIDVGGFDAHRVVQDLGDGVD